MLKQIKNISILVLVFVLTVYLAGCLPSTQAADKGILTIALVEGSPGDSGNPDPQSAYAGVALAAANFTQHSGINVVIVPYADNGDVETARKVARQIVESNAVAVIGHSTIETSRAAAEIYTAAGIPVLNAVPVTETLTGEYPYYFKVIAQA